MKKVLILFVLSALCVLNLCLLGQAYAETAEELNTKNYKISGMKCEGCISSIENKVCKKLQGVKSCEVSIGNLKVIPNTGVTIDDKLIKSLVKKSGHYKVVAVNTGIQANNSETSADIPKSCDDESSSHQLDSKNKTKN